MVCLARESAFAFIHVRSFADIPKETKFGLEISTRVDHGRKRSESGYRSVRSSTTSSEDGGGEMSEDGIGCTRPQLSLAFNTAFRPLSPLSLSYPHLSSTITRSILSTPLFISYRPSSRFPASGSNLTSFFHFTFGTVGIRLKNPTSPTNVIDQCRSLRELLRTTKLATLLRPLDYWYASSCSPRSRIQAVVSPANREARSPPFDPFIETQNGRQTRARAESNQSRASSRG